MSSVCKNQGWLNSIYFINLLIYLALWIAISVYQEKTENTIKNEIFPDKGGIQLKSLLVTNMGGGAGGCTLKSCQENVSHT